MNREVRQIDKDTRKVLREAERQGFEVTYTSRGHATVRLDGKRITTFSGTPGTASSLMHGIQHLRRAGFHWPPTR